MQKTSDHLKKADAPFVLGKKQADKETKHFFYTYAQKLYEPTDYTGQYLTLIGLADMEEDVPTLMKMLDQANALVDKVDQERVEILLLGHVHDSLAKKVYEWCTGDVVRDLSKMRPFPIDW